MNENVVKLLKEQLWYLGTFDEDANVVPVGFKDVLEDGKLAVGAVFLEATVNNIQKNGKIAVTVCNPATMESYQIKGKAEFITEGPVVDKFKAMAEQMLKGMATARGALIITPEHVIVASPGKDVKKELPL